MKTKKPRKRNPVNDDLASNLAKREGKKSHVKIGDLREVLAELVNDQVDYILKKGTKEGSPLSLLDKRADELYKQKKGEL
jgi:hypothetical protein